MDWKYLYYGFDLRMTRSYEFNLRTMRILLQLWSMWKIRFRIKNNINYLMIKVYFNKNIKIKNKNSKFAKRSVGFNYKKQKKLTKLPNMII